MAYWNNTKCSQCGVRHRRGSQAEKKCQQGGTRRRGGSVSAHLVNPMADVSPAGDLDVRNVERARDDALEMFMADDPEEFQEYCNKLYGIVRDGGTIDDTTDGGQLKITSIKPPTSDSNDIEMMVGVLSYDDNEMYYFSIEGEYDPYSGENRFDWDSFNSISESEAYTQYESVMEPEPANQEAGRGMVAGMIGESDYEFNTECQRMLREASNGETISRGDMTVVSHRPETTSSNTVNIVLEVNDGDTTTYWKAPGYYNSALGENQFDPQDMVQVERASGYDEVELNHNVSPRSFDGLEPDDDGLYAYGLDGIADNGVGTTFTTADGERGKYLGQNSTNDHYFEIGGKTFKFDEHLSIDEDFRGVEVRHFDRWFEV